ncbi:MAG: hypothetical protein WC455_12420 [Dehalococcoidia bacterium]|jgi:hypothetical protein
MKACNISPYVDKPVTVIFHDGQTINAIIANVMPHTIYDSVAVLEIGIKNKHRHNRIYCPVSTIAEICTINTDETIDDTL